jgi:ABC-type polar amino acid transport system ATPase subunit
MRSEHILEASDLSLSYGSVNVFCEVNLSLSRGDVVAIVGPSGGGKTSFLKCLDLLLHPQNGEIRFCGEIVYRATPSERPKGVSFIVRRLAGLPVEPVSRSVFTPLPQYRRSLGFIFQEFNLWPTYTLRENIAAPLVWRSEKLSVINDRVQACAQRVGIESLLDRYPSNVSGGQRQRVAIARALVTEPEVLLLDEVTSALDPELISGILDLIADLAQAGMTMVLVTHHLRFAQQVATRIAYMGAGRMTTPQDPGEFFDQREGHIARFINHLKRI